MKFGGILKGKVFNQNGLFLICKNGSTKYRANNYHAFQNIMHDYYLSQHQATINKQIEPTCLLCQRGKEASFKTALPL